VFTRNHQVDWRLVAASKLNLLCTLACGSFTYYIQFALTFWKTPSRAPLTAAFFTCFDVFIKLGSCLPTSFDLCWKDRSESHHQYYDQTTCIHLPDSTHNSSTHVDCCYVFAAQTAQEHCVYHGLRGVHRLIGSTHGLGWVGSDWVEIFFSIFSELGWVVARKKWICPLVLTNFDTLTPLYSENWIDHQNFFTFLQLCQIWHKFDTRGKGYCTKLVGKWVKYNENYLFAGYGDNGFRRYLCISCIC